MDLQKSGADHASAGRRRGTDRGRGRGRGRGDRGGQPHGRGGRAPFSHAGPNNDRSSSSVVVEQIPEEKFDDESVRGFFSSFGSIAEVTLQAYKRLAVVKFEDHDSAKRAYESPKVIFDNRFVKVYWYKPDSLPIPVNGKDDRASSAAPLKADHEMIDVAEFERKQVEAQKAHEEKAAKLKEAQTQREALDQKLKAQAEERKKLLDKLAAKTQKSAKVEAAENTAGNDGETRTDEGQKQSSQTEALKTKLAELEAEAQSMGINPEEPWSGTGRGRGRGGSSSYGGGFYGRGRGYDSSRGASRGRSALHHAALRGGAVKRLDNRTKRVAVSGIEYGTEKDEALRQFLFVSSVPNRKSGSVLVYTDTFQQNNYEVDNIETDPDRKETQIISFKERYVAENVSLQ